MHLLRQTVKRGRRRRHTRQLLHRRHYPIKKHDVIACPTGGAEVAHQIINTGTAPMRYLALSTLCEVEACEYPDSGKVSIVTGKPGEPGLHKIFRAETNVDYYDREKG